MVAQAFNPSTPRAEAGGALCSRLAWATKGGKRQKKSTSTEPCQPGILNLMKTFFKNQSGDKGTCQKVLVPSLLHMVDGENDSHKLSSDHFTHKLWHKGTLSDPKQTSK